MIAERLKDAKDKALKEFWNLNREQIFHLAEQWGISVVLNLTEQQCGISAAADLFLEESKRHGR